MRVLIVTLLISGSTLIAAPSEPVSLSQGVAPTTRYEVVLEADKDTPGFQRYELKGEASEFPAILVREISGQRIVGRLSWPGDPSGGDSQPLRAHTEVLWSPTGEAVAINTNERLHSYSSVLALEPDTGKFVQVPFPAYKTLTGFSPPNSEQLRARGFTRAHEWTREGHLIYSIHYSPAASSVGADPLSHRIALRITHKGMEVIRREPNP